MTKTEIVEQTEKYVRDNVPSSRKPDEEYFKHVFGARKFALELAREYDADIFVVDMAILLHDVGANAGKVHAKESARLAAGYLKGFDISVQEQEAIVSCIVNHSWGTEVENLEEQIIQDADGLIFISDSYKAFHKGGAALYPDTTLEEQRKRDIEKTTGMCGKIKTERGKVLAKEFLPSAIDWINSN